MKKILNLRRIFQSFILGAVLFLTISHMRYGIERAAPIDAYCPFGAIEGFLTYITTGEYLQRIYTSSFILMGIVIVLTLFFGRVFCSYFCPLGAIQEWIRGLGRIFGIKADIELPKVVDKYARYLKYIILAAVVYFSYKTGDLIFRAYDPFNALMHLGEEFDEKIIGYSILAILLVASLFSKNWWCRYFCPLGAGLGIMRKLSPFRIIRDQNSCISCGVCDHACPAGLDVSMSSGLNSADCISCLNCVSDCPKSSLHANVYGRKISKKAISIIVVAIFSISLGFFMSTPLWKTKVPSNIVMDDGGINVSNLRGSNTLEYLLNTTKIPYAVFQDRLNLPEDVERSLKLKDIGKKYDIKKADGTFIEMEDFRSVVEEYFK